MSVADLVRADDVSRRLQGLTGPLQKSFRILRRDGTGELVRRAARYAYEQSGAASTLPLLDDDVADSHSVRLRPPKRRPRTGEPLTVGWVATPPSPGSGGHTTMFRMIEALENAGHRCILFRYDRFDGDLDRQRAVIRRAWPEVRAEVRDARVGIAGVDICVATSWESAHVLARRAAEPMRFAYFVQDYEPYFYPRGSAYALAEDSYRFGFRLIALGGMVADALGSELGISSEVVEFGCDTEAYRLLGERERAGVVFFARPGFARRGYWLGRLALAEFHRRHPEVPIHVYGAERSDLPFPVRDHGRLSPDGLNALYNSCAAGLALSFTNVSLVPEEMLAAGLTPVVNESAMARAVLRNAFISWSEPTPDRLAQALADAIQRPDKTSWAEQAAASVESRNWTSTQRGLLSIIENECYGD